MRAVSVYLITNLLNGKVYVGKSINPAKRFRTHKKIAIGGREKYPKEFSAIHGAIKKYGFDNFRFEVLEEFDMENEAYFFETWWIQYLESFRRSNGYNLNQGGEGGILPTEETRQKLVAAQNRPELLQLHSDLMKEKHQQDPGFLGVINTGNQYRKGKLHTIETTTKMSQSHKNNDHHRGEKIVQSKLTNEQVIEIRKRYNDGCISQRKLASIYGVSQSIISDIITRKSWGHI